VTDATFPIGVGALCSTAINPVFSFQDNQEDL
jgi:hypothetical protein